MLKTFVIPVLALGVGATTAGAVQPSAMLDEERMARQEEARIIASPIGGFENRFWFNYRANVNEARKELLNDLRGSSDTEDLRDAWDEYRHELAHERGHYVKEMAERGYRYGTVTVGS